MQKVLLDTDIFSEILKGKNRNVLETARAYIEQFQFLPISTITVMEITKGLYKKGNQDHVQKFLSTFDALEVIDFDQLAGYWAGRIHADLERTGQPIGRADPMIAGVAMATNRTLISGNTRHFQRIVDLGFDFRLDNWKVG
jgi:tRNA(fMet)-specific endonuclease VapC